MKTVLMATQRGSNKEVMLDGPEIPLNDQIAKRDQLFKSGSNEFSSAEVCYLTPCKAAVTLPVPTNQTKKTK